MKDKKSRDSWLISLMQYIIAMGPLSSENEAHGLAESTNYEVLHKSIEIYF